MANYTISERTSAILEAMLQDARSNQVITDLRNRTDFGETAWDEYDTHRAEGMSVLQDLLLDSINENLCTLTNMRQPTPQI